MNMKCRSKIDAAEREKVEEDALVISEEEQEERR
jgi:hypothetical protein